MRVIELTKGFVAIVDDVDFEKLAQHNWSVNKDGYAQRARKKHEDWPSKMISMHRQIMGNPHGMEVDHINGDKRDNRRCNLRVATKSQNQQNRKINKNNKTGFKGISYDPKKRLYRAAIQTNGKISRLGRFKNPEDAHAAYCKAAAEKNKEFARLN